MALQKNVRLSAKRRALRVRKGIKRYSFLPRVSVFRSSKHIYAQIIDDAVHKTLVSCSSIELKNLTGDKKEVARSIGLQLAERAKKHGIEAAVFDRGQFLYHGRIKSLAEGLREGGLKV